jgi:uncharacterized C2H2 Zn-finger protein
MSHSKGLFQTCPGNFAKSGRPRDGIQTLKCGRCGALKQKRVRKCFLWCHWVNVGRPRDGVQKQKCSRCGNTGKAQVSGCFLGWHRSYHRTASNPVLRCTRCGTPATN